MRKISWIVIAFMVLLSSTSAFAEGTKTTLSVKTWFNSWEITDSQGNSFKSDNTVPMVGPAINVRLDNNIFFGGSLLFTTSDYEFPYSGGVEKLSRTDLDLIAGYMFNQYFGAFVGYKSIASDYKDEFSGSVYATGDLTLKGPGIGILGTAPLGKSVALYGSLAWMFLDYEFTYKDPIFGTSTTTDNMTGASLELGLAFMVGQKASINVGYKSQSFVGSDLDVEHNFKGFTAGFNYTF